MLKRLWYGFMWPKSLPSYKNSSDQYIINTITIVQFLENIAVQNINQLDLVISARYYLYHPTFTSIPYYSQTNFFKPTSTGLSYPIYFTATLSFNVVIICTLFFRWLWYMYYTPILLGPPSSAIGVKREERSAIKLSLSADLENRVESRSLPRKHHVIVSHKPGRHLVSILAQLDLGLVLQSDVIIDWNSLLAIQWVIARALPYWAVALS